MAVETICRHHADVNDSCKLYPCMTCDKTFHTPLSLFQHTHFIHSKNRTYSCGFCGEDHKTSEKLHQHIAECREFIKADPNEKNVSISQCSSVSDTSHCHHDSAPNCRRDDEPLKLANHFVCDQCGHHFKQKGNMDKHRLRIHNIPLPSTRQTRHQLRMKIIAARYESFETDLKKCARYAIRDHHTKSILTDNEDNVIYLSKSVAKKYADNCNILYGLQLVYMNQGDENDNDAVADADTDADADMDIVKYEPHKSIKKEWSTFKDAAVSVMNDRPNQYDMIISIVDYHIDM